jgi:hypothetical protein
MSWSIHLIWDLVSTSCINIIRNGRTQEMAIPDKSGLISNSDFGGSNLSRPNH